MSVTSASKEMMKYQYQLNDKLADENRNWQERMANSAHQREIADLQKAGLNPVLSVTGGNGATTPTGSTASVSDGAGYASALANLQAAQLNSATQLEIHNTPGGNTFVGQVKWLADELGVDTADVVQKIVGDSAGSIVSSAKADIFGSIPYLKNNKSDAYSSIKVQMLSYQAQALTASLSGNSRKAKRLQKKADRLAYYYPDIYKEVFGKKPSKSYK